MSSPIGSQVPTSDDTLFVPPPSTSEQADSDMGVIGTSELEYLEEHNTAAHIAKEERVQNLLMELTMGRSGFQIQDTLPKVDPIQLTPEQTRVHDMVVRDGLSIFFTGAAGTGKSILLGRIISSLKSKGKVVAVTASTGIAACSIGGRTIHSWAGIGLGNGQYDKLVAKVKRSQPALARWKSVNVLIVDEISMLKPDLLDALDYIGRRIRKPKNSKKPSSRPFGGIQIILTGDFFQLPPVDRESQNSERQYAFDAECWKSCINRTILLTQVFRQKDARFQSMLNELRYANLSDDSVRQFHHLSRKPEIPEGITPTHLYPRRAEVEKANLDSLAKIPKEEIIFRAIDQTYPLHEEDTQRIQQYQHDQPKIVWLAPDTVKLKEGAQVMMIKNFDSTLVNGSIGRILAWIDAPPVLDNKKVIDISTIIHSLPMQTYADLERLEACLTGKKRLVGERLPLVRFFNRDGTFRDVIVQRETWEYEDEFGRVLASRKQLPLILSYAMSIHKSQGQTLDFVKVDLRGTFEVGQAYVALSRATSLEGLQVIGFKTSKIRVDHRVVNFYDKLERIVQPTVREMLQEKPDVDSSAMDEVEEERNKRASRSKSMEDYLDMFRYRKAKIPEKALDADGLNDLPSSEPFESKIKLESTDTTGPAHSFPPPPKQSYNETISMLGLNLDDTVSYPDLKSSDPKVAKFDDEFDGSDYKFAMPYRRFSR